MKKYSVSVLVAVLLLFLRTGHSEQLFPKQAKTGQASGIISLDLCTDWMLLKYADRSQVLAFSPLLYRFRVDWVPDGLPVHNGSLEHILQLDPDLVLTGEYNAIILRKRLQQLGLRVEVMPLPTSLKSISQYQQQFQAMVKSNGNVSIIIDQFPPKNKKLLLLGANGIGTGTDTLENDVIVKSGWVNYLQQKGYVDLDLEQLVYGPPDAVLWSAPVSSSLANLFAQHTVLRRLIDKQKWFSSDYWRWQCPGPWTADLVRELAER